jgi:hypothetical protein
VPPRVLLRRTMPPRRSARLAGARAEPFSTLALALTQHVLSLLPADARARAAAVCRAWRAACAERALWRTLDLSPGAGLARAATDAVLRAAAANARGQLTSLDISQCVNVSFPELLGTVALNADSLRALRFLAGPEGELLAVPRLGALLLAAPALTAMHADVQAESAPEARRLLSNAGVFAPLRLRGLRVDLSQARERGAEAEAEVAIGLAAGVAAHASLRELTLDEAPLGTPAALDALITAALGARLTSVKLWRCGLSPASAPALARLLSGGAALRLLNVHGGARTLLDAPAATLLAAALRANSTLTALWLPDIGLWRDLGAATVLLGALTRHASVRTLDLSVNAVGGGAGHASAAQAGAALAALLLPRGDDDGAALAELDVSGCALRDEGLRPLAAALARGAGGGHLRALTCEENGVTGAFAYGALAPAGAAAGVRLSWLPNDVDVVAADW